MLEEDNSQLQKQATFIEAKSLFDKLSSTNKILPESNTDGVEDKILPPPKDPKELEKSIRETKMLARNILMKISISVI